MKDDSSFAARLLRWHKTQGRHDLPWQKPRSAYRVWVSEIMLQQTQVSTVKPYFERFMLRFPDVRALASASQDDVLQHWAGLGYYARARNLHRAAQELVEHHQGSLPESFDALISLPGVGRSTAGAILAQAFEQRFPILDGNVRRVLARYRAIEGWPGQADVQKQLWALAEELMPHARMADYTQAQMDLGNLLCTSRRPECTQCPVRTDCHALAQDRVAELPTAKPRKARPRRYCHTLIIRNTKAEILIERRPPSGIWGGLWATPVSDAEESLESCAGRYGLHPQRGIVLPSIKHIFTHFELIITPHEFSGQSESATLRENAQQQWLSLHRERQWPGLPTPLRKLLHQLRTN